MAGGKCVSEEWRKRSRIDKEGMRKWEREKEVRYSL